MHYLEEQLVEQEVSVIEDAHELLDKGGVTWINIEGVHDDQLIKSIGEKFELHPLLLEDIMDTTQRPKYENHLSYLFIVLKMMRLNEAASHVTAEQVSFVIGPNYLMSFQEETGDVFESVRERIRKQTTRIRKRGNDYLAYALMDTIVDHYLVQLEFLGDKIEDMDNTILHSKDDGCLDHIRTYKSEMNFMRRWLRPVRELVMIMQKDDSRLIQKDTRPYLGDLLDMTTYAAESVEDYREMLTEQINIFNTLSNHRLNEVMRTLTIISVVFIPMSFLAGVYGTNFEHFPELNYPWAYPAFWISEVLLGGGMLWWFYKRGWVRK